MNDQIDLSEVFQWKQFLTSFAKKPRYFIIGKLWRWQENKNKGSFLKLLKKFLVSLVRSVPGGAAVATTHGSQSLNQQRRRSVRWSVRRRRGHCRKQKDPSESQRRSGIRGQRTLHQIRLQLLSGRYSRPSGQVCRLSRLWLVPSMLWVWRADRETQKHSQIPLHEQWRFSNFSQVST